MKKGVKVGKESKKKEELLGRKKSLGLAGLGAVVVVAVLLASWLTFREGEARPAKIAGSQVLDKVNYKNQNVAMSPVEATATGGAIELPLDAVKDKKLVSFSYGNKEKRLPLMAYITPSGKLVTAMSVCEPCRSNKFHIEGNNMVCNSCFTKWDLETLEGLSGGCLKYPPDVLAHTVQGNKIAIREKDVLNWKPRI